MVQTGVLQRWICRSREPHQQPSQLREGQLPRVHDKLTARVGCLSLAMLESLERSNDMRDRDRACARRNVRAGSPADPDMKVATAKYNGRQVQ